MAPLSRLPGASYPGEPRREHGHPRLKPAQTDGAIIPHGRGFVNPVPYAQKARRAPNTPLINAPLAKRALPRNTPLFDVAHAPPFPSARAGFNATDGGDGAGSDNTRLNDAPLRCRGVSNGALAGGPFDTGLTATP